MACRLHTRAHHGELTCVEPQIEQLRAEVAEGDVIRRRALHMTAHIEQFEVQLSKKQERIASMKLKLRQLGDVARRLHDDNKALTEQLRRAEGTHVDATVLQSKAADLRGELRDVTNKYETLKVRNVCCKAACICFLGSGPRG